MILFIDSANTESLVVALVDPGGKILAKKKVAAKYKQSEKLLISIDKILKNIGDIKDIRGVIVVKGPGSFTALRIGVTTANALAFSLSVPVVGIKEDEMEVMIVKGLKILKKAKKGKWVVPEYGSEPNISISCK